MATYEDKDQHEEQDENQYADQHQEHSQNQEHAQHPGQDQHPDQAQDQPPEDTEQQQPQFEWSDTLFSLVSIVIAYLYLQLGSGRGGLWSSLVVGLFCVALLAYTKVKKIGISGWHYTYLAYVLALGLSMALFENSVLMGTNGTFLFWSTAYLILVLVGARKHNKLDNYVGFDFIDGFLLRPFKNISGAIGAYLSRGKRHKNVKYVIVGVLVSLPLASVVVLLLASADTTFLRLFTMVASRLSENLVEEVFTWLLALPMGFYLFMCVYRNMENKPMKEHAISLPKGPDVLFLTILILFISIYLLFFVAATIGYFEFRSDATTTLSAYAREGFFQLLLVSLINVLIFWGIKAFSKGSRVINVALTVIGGETLCLILLAYAKMQMYISSFGMTVLRFNTSWFMLGLLVCVGIFVVALWKPFNYLRTLLVFVGMCLLVFSYVNPGNHIVSYNYRKYQQEELRELDMTTFYSVGVEGIPKAVDIYNESDDPLLRQQLESYLVQMKRQIQLEPNVVNLQRSNGLALIEKTIG